MKMPLRATYEQQKERRKERLRIAQSSELSADEGSVQRLREVAEAQLGLQADYASSLDTQALTLLTVDVALAGIAVSVLVSGTSLPQHWVFALVPLGLSFAMAYFVVTVYGPLATGADIVEVLKHQDTQGKIDAAELNLLLARRAIEARELNLAQLDRKQRTTSRGVLALLAAFLLLGVLALADPGVQSKHGSKLHHTPRQHHGYGHKWRKPCGLIQGPIRGHHAGHRSKRLGPCPQAAP
jgi:hypothetical protein